MTARTALLPLTCASLLLAGCERSAPTTHPTEAPAKPTSAAPPSTFEGAFKHAARWDATRKALVVAIDISPGFHAYATGETVGRPLALEIAETSDYAANGAVEFPKGEAKDLPLGRSVIVEGKAEIVAPLVLAKPEGGEAGKTAKALLRYQVCTESSCDRPKSAEIAVEPTPAR